MFFYILYDIIISKEGNVNIMSVDSQTGVGVVAGVSTGGVAVLANTGLPIYIPLLIGVFTVVTVALLTRLVRK